MEATATVCYLPLQAKQRAFLSSTKLRIQAGKPTSKTVHKGKHPPNLQPDLLVGTAPNCTDRAQGSTEPPLYNMAQATFILRFGDPL